MIQPLAIEAFLSGFDWTAYGGARLAIAAIRDGKALRNLSCRIVLEVDAPDPALQAFESRIEDLLLIKHAVPLTEARAIFEEMKTGITTVGRHSVSFLSPPEDVAYSWMLYPPGSGYTTSFEWAAYRLEGNGTLLVDQARFDSIGRRLVTAVPQPLANWDAVAAFIGLGSRLNQYDRADIKCYAPIYARIRSVESSLRSNEITVTVESFGRFTSRLSLLFMPLDQRVPHVTKPVGEWTSTASNLRQATVGFPTGSGPVYVQLVSDRELVESRLAGIPSLLSRAHGSLDPDSSWLKGLVSKARKNKSGHDDLVQAIVAILNLAGCPTIDYGRNSPPHSPDFIGRIDDHRLIVGECTVGVVEGGKLEEVAGRATVIAAQLKVAGNAPSCVPVLVFPLPIISVSEDLKRHALRHGVSLLGSDEIDELIASVCRGEPAAVVSRILTRPAAYPR